MNLSDRPPCRLAAALFMAMAMLASPHGRAATITVTTVDDAIPPAADGECSLREALANASDDAATFDDCPAGSGDDEITFLSGLFRSSAQFTATIHLAGTLPAGKHSGAAHALAIRPPGATGTARRVRLVASGDSPHRVMEVRPTAMPFTLERTSIEGGRVLTGEGNGGGAGVLLASQDARFEAVHFIDNVVTILDGGGALYQLEGNGELRISNGLFQHNSALRGGAIRLHDVAPGHRVHVLDTLFLGNSAEDYIAAEGGAIHFEVAWNFSGVDTPLLDIARSRFVDNHGGFWGGALSAWAASGTSARLRLQISDSLFQGNQSDYEGGGLIVDGNGPGSSVHIKRSSFIGNHANHGSQGPGRGGGINATGVDLHIDNSLFAENRASRGGALNVQTGAAARTLSLVGNSFHRQTQYGEDTGRTLALWIPADASSISLTLAGNLFDPVAQMPYRRECEITGGATQPPVLRGGDNLSPLYDCLLLDAADLRADPMVTASDSGDPLKPLLLLPQPGSPAIDAWPAEACTDALEQPLDHDLRGVPRPADGDDSGTADCDIGAFERPETTIPVFTDGFED